MTGECQIRVRYAETDRMGLLHHANYLVYFEQARTELLRQMGLTYRDLEDQGFYLVVAKLEVRYKRPAHYDDVLTIRTTVTRSSPVRLEHKYEVFGPDGQLCCEGNTTLACVDGEGKIQPMPEFFSANPDQPSGGARPPLAPPA
ncbi:MAG: acyl-CoA thioesterase [Fimbriiglobus sp.]|jgi:acyl-CoA thioester hydrolase|nr:acyl-CoA thioesterase [Fimbriiglobus sp.]